MDCVEAFDSCESQIYEAQGPGGAGIIRQFHKFRSKPGGTCMEHITNTAICQGLNSIYRLYNLRNPMDRASTSES